MGLQIGGDGERVCPDLGRHLMDELGAINQHQGRAFRRGAQRHSAANALRRTGDENDLAAEAVGREMGHRHAAFCAATPEGANFS